MTTQHNKLLTKIRPNATFMVAPFNGIAAIFYLFSNIIHALAPIAPCGAISGAISLLCCVIISF